MGVRLVLITLVSVLSSSSLFAQAHDTSTAAVPGPVARAASHELRQLTLQTPNGVRTERRRNDSLLNGALIGAAAGVGTGIALCLAMEPWEICNNASTVVPFGALGAAIGLGVDALIRKREVNFVPIGSTQVAVAPVAARGGGGVRVNVRF